jgi:hypothetical protein
MRIAALHNGNIEIDPEIANRLFGWLASARQMTHNPLFAGRND